MTRHEHKFTAGVLALALTPVGSAHGLAPSGTSCLREATRSRISRPPAQPAPAAARLRSEGTP